MELGDDLALLVLLAVLLGVVGWLVVRRRRAGPETDPVPGGASVDHEFDPTTSSSMPVGFRVGARSAMAGLATLTLDRHVARVECRLGPLSSRGPSPVWVRRSDVTVVRAVSGWRGRGLQFDTPDGHLDGVLVWVSDPTVALASFADHGWPVSGG